MRINKLYIVLGLVIAFALFFELAAHADQTNELTKITFSAPVQIPGKVLPAGTYVFEQADPNDDQDLVRILSADRSVLYATLQTIPTDRQEPTGETTITLAEPESGQPEMLVKWFYPGSLTGHQFMYSRRQERAIAQAKQETVAGDQAVPSSEAAGK
ncbi:MAG TPA: hypothetical protein VNX88_02060 [Terriglobales bacterium]|jgi:hypothetical protein|nr:hypothetical protein [Terriglobales bacterium]